MGRDGRRLLSGGRAVGSGGAEDVVVFGTELCRGAELNARCMRCGVPHVRQRMGAQLLSSLQEGGASLQL